MGGRLGATGPWKHPSAAPWGWGGGLSSRTGTLSARPGVTSPCRRCGYRRSNSTGVNVRFLTLAPTSGGAQIRDQSLRSSREERVGAPDGAMAVHWRKTGGFKRY